MEFVEYREGRCFDDFPFFRLPKPGCQEIKNIWPQKNLVHPWQTDS